ncbi:hypothetical protein BSU04_35985 [Caballeronia sordidicola]|uniref:Uncharacterized protein n=1 Tax=Caballeronia sordidicola TaxID=196367 RepID=A0A226WQY3_CABSO|nr:hypothetical protein BSU04_35985 [Caballeronia sordidicola]
MIAAMKPAIAHWLSDDRWRTVRPPLERQEPVMVANLL